MDNKFKQLQNVQDITNFTFGGNATITLESLKSGKHFTFKVRQAKKDDSKSPFFVSVLSGPDNHANYSYVGVITSDKKEFKLTQKSKVSSDALSYKAFNFFFVQLISGKIHNDLKIYHSGKCGRCGKKLTDPRSIENGLGPECSKRVNKYYAK